MKKNILITVAVIGSLILLIIGFSLGLSLGQKWAQETEVEKPLTDLLASKVISILTAVASGEITEISGRNLTLNKEGDTFTVLIREDAIIDRLLPPEEDTETPQPAVREGIAFEELKVGDQVNISCELKADGSLEGMDVVVLP